MKAVVQLLLALILLVGATRSASCQAATPEAALEELVTTESITDALKHLPPEAQKIMESLNPEDKKEFAQRMLPQAWLKRQHVTLTREGTEWKLMRGEQRQLYEISIAGSMISGTDALLRLLLNHSDEMLVSMRLQEGEWRVTAFGSWSPKRIDSGEILRRLTPMGTNEAAALETLEEIRSAVNQYSWKHSETGYPANLQALSVPDNQDDEKETANAIDPSLLAIPLIRNGYEFHYTLLSAAGDDNGNGHISITAVPVEFRRSGERSFLTDETGAIRFTSADRTANENDDELDQSFMRSQGSPVTISMPCTIEDRARHIPQR